jgi:hypothetical protein
MRRVSEDGERQDQESVAANALMHSTTANPHRDRAPDHFAGAKF